MPWGFSYGAIKIFYAQNLIKRLFKFKQLFNFARHTKTEATLWNTARNRWA
jgi:hypothetical protein